MIRLRDLISESKASEMAKKKGLKHTGGGYYADASGEIVAKSENQGKKLVPVKGKKAPKKMSDKEKQALKKPLVTRKKKSKSKIHTPVGITLDDLPQPKVIKTMAGERIIDRNTVNYFARTSVIEGEEITIHAPMDWVGSSVLRSDHKRLRQGAETQLMLWEKFHKLPIGENFRKIWEALHADEREEGVFPMEKVKEAVKYDNKKKDEWRENSKRAVHHASFMGKRQATVWRPKQSPELTAYSLILQTEWQYDGNWTQEEEQRRAKNQVWNEYIKDKDKPATIPVPPNGYLSRGMVINADDAEEFLKQFQLGEEVSLPPSGFSTDPKVAGQFLWPYMPQDGITVMIKVYPKKGKRDMVGLSLADSKAKTINMMEQGNVKKWRHSVAYARRAWAEQKVDSWLEDNPEAGPQERDRQMRIREHQAETYLFDDDAYQHEAEVIRPGNIRQKVVNVEKHIIPTPSGGTTPLEIDQRSARVCYLIELEETDWTDDPSLIMEGVTIGGGKKVLFKYFNKSIRFAGEKIKKPAKDVLSKYMNTNVRGK